MPPAPQQGPPSLSNVARIRELAIAVLDAYVAYHDAFLGITRRAAANFATRDWDAVRRDATARLTLYVQLADRAIADVERRCGERGQDDRRLWTAIRDAYAGCVQGRPDQEIAETFFSSVTRRRFATTGVDRSIEFLDPWTPGPLPEEDDPDRRHHTADSGIEQLAQNILSGCKHKLTDPDRDRRQLAAEISRACRARWGDEHLDGAEVLAPLFYRNKGAYLVGRLRRGEELMPLIIALLTDDRGVYADAVLTSSDEASIVFGFARSYFNVALSRPRATVAFLQSIMPQKRVDELYTAIGYHKHGKTELYRQLSFHLAAAEARFEEAEGARGLVMAVFTLPALNIVLKVIRDRIGAPKRTTRRHVMEQYRRVFLRDRVGRLADAQLFQGLEFRRSCFPAPLCDELLSTAPSAVRVDGEMLVFGHLYTERRLRPLNLYLQEVDAVAAEAAILDYGEAIRDLAAANIFPGDLLLKNFGVSRHARVIFYDYDELAVLTDCHFRRLPQAKHVEDELAAEPWFAVSEHDVFPEEFVPFLVPAGRLRDVFLDAHSELLDPNWWRGQQERQLAGELVDTFPYQASRRLRST